MQAEQGAASVVGSIPLLATQAQDARSNKELELMLFMKGNAIKNQEHRRDY